MGKALDYTQDADEDLSITAEKKTFFTENYRIFKNRYIDMKSGKNKLLRGKSLQVGKPAVG